MASWSGSDYISGDDTDFTEQSVVAPVATESAVVEILEISDRIREALECPVCLDLSTDLMCYCPNGHVICRTCLVRVRASSVTNNCPMCRSPMSRLTGGPLTAFRLVLALPLVSVACVYWQFGCRALVRVMDIAQHEAHCEHCPDVRCLVTTCPWLGTYDLLYDHVHTKHPEAVVRTKDDRLTVIDVNRIECNRRRVYLVTTDRGNTLMWVLMIRKTRTHIQAGVFVVDPEPGLGRSYTPQQQQQQQQKQQQWGGNARPTDMGYRLTYKDAEGRCKERSETRWVGRWHSSSLDMGHCGYGGGGGGGDDDGAESYTTFWSRTGRVEVHWFRHATGRCTRYPDSCVRVMDAARK